MNHDKNYYIRQLIFLNLKWNSYKKLKKTITKTRFEEQCKKFEILTSLKTNAESVACIRRQEGYGVVFKQLSPLLEVEFMGYLIFSIQQDKVQVIDATIY